jgi:hypothetical protein
VYLEGNRTILKNSFYRSSVYPKSGRYNALLWNDSTADKPGNINLGFNGYTYPIYELVRTEEEVPVEITMGKYAVDRIGVEEIDTLTCNAS